MTTPLVLVCRPAEDAAPFAAALAERGVEAVVAPLLEVVFHDGPAPDLEGVRGLLVTSANGARAFARVCPERRVPVLAVGDSSAACCRALGFGDVRSAAGNVEALARLVRETARPWEGPLLHIAGGEVAGDLAHELLADGYAYRRAVLYEARSAQILPTAAATALLDDRLAGCAFHSPRTAATFVDLVRDAGLDHACRRLRAFCLSAGVAARADDLEWAAIHVAERPEQAALTRRIVETLAIRPAPSIS